MDSSEADRTVTNTQTNESIPLRIENVQGNKIKPKETNSKKIHISKFLILVNSNVAATDDLDKSNRVADCLKDGIGKALQEHGPDIYVIKPPAKEKYGPGTILDIKVKMAAEIGPRYKRVHVHALVTVKHTTLLQMDGKVLRGLLLDYCKDEAIKNLFVRIRFVPVSDFAELYLEKDPLPSST